MYDYTRPNKKDKFYHSDRVVEQTPVLKEETVVDEPVVEVRETFEPEKKSDDIHGVATTRLRVRERATKESPEVAILSKGDKVDILSEQGDWYHVKTKRDGDGFCMAQFIELVD